MDKISIVFATRNRPHNLRRYYASLVNTADVMPEVCLYIDDDDVLSVPAAEECGFKYIQGPRCFLQKGMNLAVDKLSTGNILMFSGDDCPFRYKGWDSLVISEFQKYEDRIVLVHGSDGELNFESNAAHGFISREWVDAVGYFMPLYRNCDQWLVYVAELLQRHVYLPYLISEHMHPTYEKAPVDDTYREGKVGAGAWGETPRDAHVEAEKLRLKILSGAPLCEPLIALNQIGTRIQSRFDVIKHTKIQESAILPAPVVEEKPKALPPEEVIQRVQRKLQERSLRRPPR